MNSAVKGWIKRLPLARQLLARMERLQAERDQLLAELDDLKAHFLFPPGHFYSPLPALDEVRRDEEAIFASPPELAGIDLNEREQLLLFDSLKQYYPDIPFTPQPQEGLRYFYENDYYGYSDAIILHCMIRHARPRRIVEVGSGYSSCVMLDTSEHFFAGSIECVFIDPYPERLLGLVKEGDLAGDGMKARLVRKRVQEVEPGVFETLERGDILFIDSSHVSKTGSDVNHIFFRILPRVASGVYIHFHDIFYPLEYPRELVYGRFFWNEIYLLRAFLQYNERFKIVFFNTYLEQLYESRFAAEMPLCLRNPGGSLWLVKV